MAWTDVFRRKPALEKHLERAINRRAQTHERLESLRFLANDASPEALGGLLQRFTFRVDPGITDQQEKDDITQWLIQLGAPVIPAVSKFLRQTESIARPLQVLRELVAEDELTAELLQLLGAMDTEYERDPQRKSMC